MEKKFRTLSACLRRGRLSILFALLFALQTGYGTPAAAQDTAAGISGQTCSATASGKVTDETGTPVSGVVVSDGRNWCRNRQKRTVHAQVRPFGHAPVHLSPGRIRDDRPAGIRELPRFLRPDRACSRKTGETPRRFQVTHRTAVPTKLHPVAGRRPAIRQRPADRPL